MVKFLPVSLPRFYVFAWCDSWILRDQDIPSRCYKSFFTIFVVQCSVCFFVQMTFFIFFDSILDFVSFCINLCFAFYRDEMCERNGALCLCERKSANAFMDPHLLDVLIGTAVQAANQLLSVLPQLICMTNPPLCQICEAKCCIIAVLFSFTLLKT